MFWKSRSISSTLTGVEGVELVPTSLEVESMLLVAPCPPPELSIRRLGVPLPTTLVGRPAPFVGLCCPALLTCDRLTGMPDGKTGGPEDEGERW